MNRQDVLNLYTVNEHGIITSPGKFEGEPLYVPYFWDMGINGSYERIEIDETDGKAWLTYFVYNTDIDEFPELHGVSVVYLHGTEQGFISSDIEERKRQ